MSLLESRRKFCDLGTGNEENKPLFLGEFREDGRAMGNGWVEKGKGARDEQSPWLWIILKKTYLCAEDILQK